MREHLIVIYDRASKLFSNLRLVPDPRVAIRDFQIACNSPDSTFASFPQDFALCEIGQFDPVTGELFPFEEINYIQEAKDLVKVSDQV